VDWGYHYLLIDRAGRDRVEIKDNRLIMVCCRFRTVVEVRLNAALVLWVDLLRYVADNDKNYFF